MWATTSKPPSCVVLPCSRVPQIWTGQVSIKLSAASPLHLHGRTATLYPASVPPPADMLPYFTQASASLGSQLLAVPIVAFLPTLSYRLDIFHQYNLTVPGVRGGSTT
jgi:hypothetical protein